MQLKNYIKYLNQIDRFMEIRPHRVIKRIRTTKINCISTIKQIKIMSAGQHLNTSIKEPIHKFGQGQFTEDEEAQIQRELRKKLGPAFISQRPAGGGKNYN